MICCDCFEKRTNKFLLGGRMKYVARQVNATFTSVSMYLIWKTGYVTGTAAFEIYKRGSYVILADI